MTPDTQPKKSATRASAFPHTFLPLALAIVLAALLASPAAVTGQSTDIPTVEARTEGMERMPGLFDLYWDEGTGSLFWLFPEIGQEFLYQISMGSGLGSNPVGIDRGQLRGTHVLEATRIRPYATPSPRRFTGASTSPRSRMGASSSMRPTSSFAMHGT
jgi:hypothetical protein